MRIKILTTVLLTAFCFIFLSGVVNADICIIKHPSTAYENDDPTFDHVSSYSGTESLTPCTDAVTSGTGTISLDFSVGEDIALDVVFEQKMTDPQVPFGYDTKWYYDSTNMTDASCTSDPLEYFGNLLGAECTGGTISTSRQDFIETFPGEYNAVLNYVTFANGYSNGDSYTLSFEDTPNTDLLTVSDCYLILGDGGCTPHDLMTTVINVTAPPCYVTAPSSAPTVTCIGQEGCTPAPSGNATVTMTYSTSGMKCVDASCNDVTSEQGCSGFGIEFTNIAGSSVTASQTTGSTTYTETVDLASVSSAQYTNIVGNATAGGCQSSASLPAACGTSSQSSNTAACKCGDPPTLTFTNASNFGADGKTYLEGVDIDVIYEVTDPDAADSGTIEDSIPTSNIVFYVTNDNGVTVYNTKDDSSDIPACTLTSTSTTVGTIKCTIPGKIDKAAFVNEDVDYIYFGVIVQDDKGLSGEYPVNFDGTDLTQGNYVDGDNIIVGTSFGFVPLNEPYPNQFPYQASANMPLRIYFQYNEEAHVILRIYSMDGMLVRQIDNSSQPIITEQNQDVDCSGEDCNRCHYGTGCLWDGTTYEGGNNLVANGMYIFNLHATSQGDNFKGATHNYTKGIVVMK